MSPSTTRSLVVAALAGSLAIVAVGGSTTLSAQEKSMQRHVTVTAEGSVSARPDMARISSGVVSEAETATTALTANSTAMEKLIAGLKGAGIAAEDIKTTSFNVSPRYVHNRDGQPPRIDGYRVSNDVAVIVRDLGKLGALLDQLVRHGGNQIGGLNFDIAKADALKDEARRAAIGNARKRAELYATAAGARLGDVLSISEETVHVAPRGAVMTRAAMAESVPIAEGSQDVEVRVTATWELK